jgi:hypothetical protein
VKPSQIPPHLRTGSEEQAACIEVLRSTGWTVYTNSSRGRARIGARGKGVLDIVAFKPNRILFWDSKTYEKVSEKKNASNRDQGTFMREAFLAGAEVGAGTADMLRDYLTARGKPA